MNELTNGSPNNLMEVIDNLNTSQSSALVSRMLNNQMIELQQQVEQIQMESSRNHSTAMRQINSLDKKVDGLDEEISGNYNTLAKTFVRVSDKFGIVEEDINATKEIAISSNRVKTSYNNYMSQGDFGKQFRVVISSVRVGRLLRVVGIALVSKSKTEPYSNLIPRYAKNTIVDGRHPHFLWNFGECLKKIDKWLKDNDYYNDFNIIETEGDMEIFIDNLYRVHAK